MRTWIGRVGKTAGALLLVAVAVSGSREASPRPGPTPAAPVPDLGIVWQADIPETSGYAPAGDTVVAVAAFSVTGIDRTTGLRRWRFQPPSGFAIVSWEVSDGAVVVAMDNSSGPTSDIGSNYRWEITGLEATTGRRLWDNTRALVQLLPSTEYSLRTSYPERLASGAGVIVVPWYEFPSNAHLGLAGVAARTGELAWVQKFGRLSIGGFSACDTIAGSDSIDFAKPLVAAGNQIAAVVAQCAEGEAVIGFDPRGGSARWATPLHGDKPDRLIIDRDTILVGQSRHGTILDLGGRVLFGGDLPPKQRMMAVIDDIAVVAGTDGSSDPLVAVDLRGGRTLWSLARPSSDSAWSPRRSTYRGLTVVNGTILGYRSAAGGWTSGPSLPVVFPTEPGPNLLPAVIDRIDPLTGAVQSTALPVVEGWQIAADKLLFLLSGRRLYALRLTPDGSPFGDNAPAAPDRWPDACALLTPGQIQNLWPGRRLTLGKQSGSVLDRPIPKPVQCHITDPQGQLVAIVAVKWVAGDQHGAEALAASARSSIWYQTPEPPMLPAAGTWAFGDAATLVTLRAGPVIAELLSQDVLVPAVEIARLAAENLRSLGYQ